MKKWEIEGGREEGKRKEGRVGGRGKEEGKGRGKGKRERNNRISYVVNTNSSEIKQRGKDGLYEGDD